MNSNNTDVELDPLWYKQKMGILGKPLVRITGSITYILGMIAPLLLFIIEGSNSSKWLADHRILVMLWATFAALAYPSYAWIETITFEAWVRKQSAERRSIERAYFKLNTDLAKNFWTAMAAIYTVAGIFTLALKTS